MWQFSSGVEGGLIPTPWEVFFLPPWRRYSPAVDKFFALLPQLANVVLLRASIFSGDPDDPVVPVFDRNEDESLFLQGTDVGPDLAFADIEEVGEVSVRRVTAIGVVKRMDFDKQHFFHQRQLI